MVSASEFLESQDGSDINFRAFQKPIRAYPSRFSRVSNGGRRSSFVFVALSALMDVSAQNL